MSDSRHPRIPRWLKLLTLLIATPVVVAIVGYLLWSRSAGNELDAQVAVYQALGEPIEPADFIATPVPDDDNAAIALREAARIDDQSKEWKAADPPGEPGLPLTDKEVAAFRAVIAVNPNAFAGVDDAMKRKGVDWQIPMRSPVVSVLLPDLNEQRRLATLLSWSALLHFQKGEHDLALADLNRIVFISRTVDLQPTLVSHLVAMGIMGMACEPAQQMSPELKIGASKGDASPERVRKLIADLLDDGPPNAGRRRAFFGERMIELDCARCIGNGTLDFSSISTGGGRSNPAATAVGVALKPLAYSDGAFMMRRTTDHIRGMESSPDWPTFKDKVPAELPPEIRDAKFRHALANIVMPSFHNAVQTDYRAATDRRLSAIVLAMRLYSIDHAGKLPEKLTDLVPAYLPAVPLDALAQNQPLRYIPDPKNPIVYSVGKNNADDGGSERVVEKNPGNQSNKWAQADYVIHLTRQPRPTPD